MKRSLLIILSAVLVLGGYSGGGTAPATDTGKAQETASGPVEEATQKEATRAETAAPPKKVKELLAGEFDELLVGLPVSAVNTEYIIQDDQYKFLYPDLLSTVIQNHTDENIKDAVLTIVAWDNNKLPVKLTGNMDFQGGEYFKKVNHRDINLVGGGIFGEDPGFSVDKSCKVDSFKTIILFFETFDGDKWRNPYEDSFRQAYEGKEYTGNMKVQVEMQDADFVKSDTPSETRVENASAEELEASLASQPVFVSNTNYAVQNDRHRSIYPDLLQAITQNNSGEDIHDAVLVFVTWDSNGLPVKIKGQMSFNDPTYVTEVLFEDINLVPGGSCGDSQGYVTDEDCAIKSFKAMAVSYIASEDKTWKNPKYKAFCDLYEGKRSTQQ